MDFNLIDQATITALKESLGDDFLPELIATYLEETPSLIHDLHQALAEGNAQVFQRAAHSIKSSSASLGALSYAALAKELEMAGKAGDLSQVSDRLNELTGGFTELEKALKGLA